MLLLTDNILFPYFYNEVILKDKNELDSVVNTVYECLSLYILKNLHEWKSHPTVIPIQAET